MLPRQAEQEELQLRSYPTVSQLQVGRSSAGQEGSVSGMQGEVQVQEEQGEPSGAGRQVDIS